MHLLNFPILHLKAQKAGYGNRHMGQQLVTGAFAKFVNHKTFV